MSPGGVADIARSDAHESAVRPGDSSAGVPEDGRNPQRLHDADRMPAAGGGRIHASEAGVHSATILRHAGGALRWGFT